MKQLKRMVFAGVFYLFLSMQTAGKTFGEFSTMDYWAYGLSFGFLALFVWTYTQENTP
jgi:hypothetical protein